MSIAFRITLQPETSYASLWDDAWQTKDQQAQQAYQDERYFSAASLFEHNQWQGSAHYKAGNYEQALASFEQDNSATGLYNQGNTLAKMQQYQQAINAYEKALAKNPNLQDAKDNLEKIKQLQQQQQQKQEQQEE